MATYVAGTLDYWYIYIYGFVCMRHIYYSSFLVILFFMYIIVDPVGMLIILNERLGAFRSIMLCLPRNP
jgi:hypothetical protein